MNNIPEFWQVFNYLFPEQSLPFVLLTGLILSLIFTSDSISILNFARQSKFIIFDNSVLRKIYLAYPSGLTYFWILTISALVASFSYYLFNLSRLVSIPLALIIQIMFACQAFPTMRYVKPIMQASKVFKDEGTIAGLVVLRSNLHSGIKAAPVWQLYNITLHDYLMQVTIYWLIPLIVLFFGFWPFTFFYLTFVIQYQEFNLYNKIVNQILRLPHIMTLVIMRCLFLFCRGSQIEKSEFKAEYLSFSQIFLFDKHAMQKIDSERKQNSGDTCEQDFDQAYGKENESPWSNQNQITNTKYQAINLYHLKLVENLCLGAMTIIMGFGLLIIYLRANY